MIPQTPVMPPTPGLSRSAQQRKPFIAPMQMPVVKPGLATDVPQPGITPVDQTAMRAPSPMPATAGLSSSATGGGSTMPVGGGTATAMGAPRTSRYGSDNPTTRGAPVQSPPNMGGPVNPAWAPQGGISPFDVDSGNPGIGEFQRYSDNAYSEATRRLDPQFEAQQRAFDQDMVNRGIAPGTPAYDNARANFDQSRNDAYASARAQADQLGLAAQQQAFSQGAINSQGLRELLLGQMGLDASRFGATTSANASMHNANTAAQSAAERLRFDSQQGDFDNLMRLLGFSQGTQGFNNQQTSNWMGQNAGLLGLFQPGGAPANIDVTGPYNNQYNAGLNTAQANQAQQNANTQAAASMIAAMYCDRDAKTEIAEASPDAALSAIDGLPFKQWTYKADPKQTAHVGTYAQAFNTALGLPPGTHINPIDLFGALIGSVQALSARVKELETT